MPISFACRCGRTLRVPDDHAGKHALCPGCRAVLAVPSAAAGFEVIPAPPPLEPEPNPAPPRQPGGPSLTLTCTCRAQLRVPADTPAAFARCPACGATVPTRPTAPAVPAQLAKVVLPPIELMPDPPPPVDPEAEWAESLAALPDPPPPPPPTVEPDDDDRPMVLYEPPAVVPALKLKTPEKVAKKVLKGDRAGDPYEITEEEFQADLAERRQKRDSGQRKLVKAAILIGIGAFGFVLFIVVGQLTAGTSEGVAAMTDARRATRTAGRIGQAAIVFCVLTLYFLYWLIERASEDK